MENWGSWEIDGERIFIYRSDRINKNVFWLEKKSKQITPKVSHISYNEELEYFLISDEITTWNHIVGHIYFYIDSSGIPVSNIFTDLNDVEFPIDHSLDYLEKYEARKAEIQEELNDITAEHFYESKEKIESELKEKRSL